MSKAGRLSDSLGNPGLLNQNFWDGSLRLWVNLLQVILMLIHVWIPVLEDLSWI